MRITSFTRVFGYWHAYFPSNWWRTRAFIPQQVRDAIAHHAHGEGLCGEGGQHIIRQLPQRLQHIPIIGLSGTTGKRQRVTNERVSTDAAKREARRASMMLAQFAIENPSGLRHRTAFGMIRTCHCHYWRFLGGDGRIDND